MQPTKNDMAMRDRKTVQIKIHGSQKYVFNTPTLLKKNNILHNSRHVAISSKTRATTPFGDDKNTRVIALCIYKIFIQYMMKSMICITKILICVMKGILCVEYNIQ